LEVQNMKIAGATKAGIGMLLLGALFLWVGTGIVLAQDLMVYPAKGQSSDQTEKDKFECYSWAKGQTGFDPMAMPTATRPAPQSSGASTAGGAVKGGAGGALGGLAIGAIAGNAKRGAAIGAASGALFGGARSHNQKKQDEQAQQQWANEQASNYARQRSEYNRAYAACLEGKGYSVK
jgi:predicted lipid-binding transport protein (Tim44 family)